MSRLLFSEKRFWLQRNRQSWMLAVHYHRFIRSSNNILIVPTMRKLMIISQYSLIQNKSNLGIYHPNYLLNSVTWLVAVNFGSFWWFGRYVSCSLEYKSRSIFWAPFHVQKIRLVQSIYGTNWRYHLYHSKMNRDLLHDRQTHIYSQSLRPTI